MASGASVVCVGDPGLLVGLSLGHCALWYSRCDRIHYSMDMEIALLIVETYAEHQVVVHSQTAPASASSLPGMGGGEQS
jgi:hypothetical protein